MNFNFGSTIIKSVYKVIGTLIELLKIPLLIVAVLIAIILIVYAGCELYYYLKGYRPTGTEHYSPKKENIFKTLFLGIRQAAYDHRTRNIEHIPEQYTGLFCVEGMPGSGKSTSAVYDARKLKEEFPKIKVYTNMDVKFQDGEIAKWQNLMEYNNGENGQIYILDEIGTLLNSRNFASFPPEALDMCTQSRKIRTRILYTTQEFKFADITLRRLTREVWRPITIARTICILIKYKPVINSDGEIEKKKLKGIEIYRQTPELRECFDTRKQIAVIKRDGFAPRSEQIRPEGRKQKTENTIEIKQKK